MKLIILKHKISNTAFMSRRNLGFFGFFGFSGFRVLGI